MTEDELERLADENPRALLSLIESGRLAPHDLTFAAEIAGRIDRPDDVRIALTPLLAHSEAVVREGALYGLRGCHDASTIAVAERMAQSDPSPGVRRAASGLLDI